MEVWLIAALMLAMGLLLIRPKGGLLAPAGAFAAFWSTLVVATLVLYPSSYFTWTAVGVIGLAVVTFTIGTVLAAGDGEAIEPPDRDELPSRNSVKALVAVGACSNIVAAAVALRVNGFGLAHAFSLDGLLQIANSVSIARYTSDDYGSLWIPPLLGLGYAAALVAPFLPRRTRNQWAMVLAPVLTSLVYASVTTERLGMIISAAFTGGGFIAATLWRTGQVPRLSGRLLAGIVAAGLAITVSFTAVAFLRTGRVDSGISQAVYDKQIVYALGSLPAFAQWYEDYRSPKDQGEPLGLGTASLAGMEFLTGQSRDETRSYGEFAIIDPEAHQTNIYTSFRSLIHDFGEAGALLVLLVGGFVMGRLYGATRMRGSLAAAGLLACCYGVLLLSHLMPITSFTNVTAGMVLAVIVLTRQGLPTIERRSVSDRGCAVVPSENTHVDAAVVPVVQTRQRPRLSAGRHGSGQTRHRSR